MMNRKKMEDVFRGIAVLLIGTAGISLASCGKTITYDPSKYVKLGDYSHLAPSSMILLMRLWLLDPSILTSCSIWDVSLLVVSSSEDTILRNMILMSVMYTSSERIPSIANKEMINYDD